MILQLSSVPNHCLVTAWSWVGYLKLVSIPQIPINPFTTGDAYMRQLFHCLQWYAGSERVKPISPALNNLMVPLELWEPLWFWKAPRALWGIPGVPKFLDFQHKIAPTRTKNVVSNTKLTKIVNCPPRWTEMPMKNKYNHTKFSPGPIVFSPGAIWCWLEPNKGLRFGRINNAKENTRTWNKQIIQTKFENYGFIVRAHRKGSSKRLINWAYLLRSSVRLIDCAFKFWFLVRLFSLAFQLEAFNQPLKLGFHHRHWEFP